MRTYVLIPFSIGSAKWQRNRKQSILFYAPNVECAQRNVTLQADWRTDGLVIGTHTMPLTSFTSQICRITDWKLDIDMKDAKLDAYGGLWCLTAWLYVSWANGLNQIPWLTGGHTTQSRLPGYFITYLTTVPFLRPSNRRLIVPQRMVSSTCHTYVLVKQPNSEISLHVWKKDWESTRLWTWPFLWMWQTLVAMLLEMDGRKSSHRCKSGSRIPRSNDIWWRGPWLIIIHC